MSIVVPFIAVQTARPWNLRVPIVVIVQHVSAIWLPCLIVEREVQNSTIAQ